MTYLTIWAHDTGFGIGWTATQTNQNLDMTKHGYVLIEYIEIKASEEDALDLINLSTEEVKAKTRAKLVAELEALDNE